MTPITVGQLLDRNACKEGMFALAEGMGWQYEKGWSYPQLLDVTLSCTLQDILVRGRGLKDVIWALPLLPGDIVPALKIIVLKHLATLPDWWNLFKEGEEEGAMRIMIDVAMSRLPASIAQLHAVQAAFTMPFYVGSSGVMQNMLQETGEDFIAWACMFALCDFSAGNKLLCENRTLDCSRLTVSMNPVNASSAIFSRALTNPPEDAFDWIMDVCHI